MNIELILLIKKHTDSFIEQTKTKSRETLEFEMSKQMETFSFNPPINLSEEGKWLQGVTSFECTTSVFKITDENNSFSVITPGDWNSESAEKANDQLVKLIDLSSENDIELHVEQNKKKGKILIKDYSVSSLGNVKKST